MRAFFDVWWKVIFLFAAGNSVPALAVILLWYVAGIDYWSPWREATSHAGPLVVMFIFFGCSMAAWAIYDGGFVGSVKPSHWSNKKRDETVRRPERGP
jgi:hypothetical protein